MLDEQTREEIRAIVREELDERTGKFVDACRPVVEYLRRNHTPYEKIIVDWTSSELFSGELGASYKWSEEDERKGALTRDDIKVDF